MTDTRSLQRLIHVGCRQLGLDGEMRHDLQLLVTGKASIVDMDDGDLRRVVKALEERGFKPGFKGGEKGRRAPAPRADLRYVHVLWRLLSEAEVVERPGRGGLNAFIRSRFGAIWGAEVIDVDALRDARQINDVVQALKAMCRRAGIETERRAG